MNVTRLLGVAAVVVVAGGLALAFIFLGTPAHQRGITIDERRLDDLMSIAGTVHGHFATGGLPERLPSTYLGSDPVTNRSYEYRRVDPHHYVLCAVFDTDQTAGNGEVRVAPPRGDWRHGTGRACYEINVTDDVPIPQRL